MQESWEKVKRALEPDLPESLLDPLRPLSVREGRNSTRFVFGVPDETLIPVLRNRYEQAMRLRLASLMGRQVQIEFQPHRPSKPAGFATFVEGPSNRMALKAARAALAEPGRHGPLYLYGPSGSGKSHLARAMSEEAAGEGRRVLWLGGTEKRTARGQPDLVVLETNLLARGQEARVLGTLRRCTERRGQVVALGRVRLAKSDLASEYRELLASGIQIFIAAPDATLARRFLDLEFETAGMTLPRTTAMAVLQLLPSDFELLRAVARKLLFLAQNQALPQPGDLSAALAEFLPEAPDRTALVGPEQILDLVAHTFGVPPADILGNSRRARLTLPRHVGMVLCVRLTDLNKSAVARFFKRNDHSTVINAEKNVSRRLARDPDFRAQMSAMERRLTGGTNSWFL